MKILILWFVFFNSLFGAINVELKTEDTKEVVDKIVNSINININSNKLQLTYKEALKLEKTINNQYKKNKKLFDKDLQQKNIKRTKLLKDRSKLENKISSAKQDLNIANSDFNLNNKRINILKKNIEDIKKSLEEKPNIKNIYATGVFIAYETTNINSQPNLIPKIYKFATKELRGKYVSIIERNLNHTLIREYKSIMSAKIESLDSIYKPVFIKENNIGRKLHFKVLFPKLFPYDQQKNQTKANDDISTENVFYIKTLDDLKSVKYIDTILSNDELDKIKEYITQSNKTNIEQQKALKELLNAYKDSRTKLKDDLKRTILEFKRYKKNISIYQKNIESKKKKLEELNNDYKKLSKKIESFKKELNSSTIITKKAMIFKIQSLDKFKKNLIELIKIELPRKLKDIQISNNRYEETQDKSSKMATKITQHYIKAKITPFYRVYKNEMGALVVLEIKMDKRKVLMKYLKLIEKYIDDLGVDKNSEYYKEYILYGMQNNHLDWSYNNLGIICEDIGKTKKDNLEKKRFWEVSKKLYEISIEINPKRAKSNLEDITYELHLLNYEFFSNILDSLESKQGFIEDIKQCISLIGIFKFVKFNFIDILLIFGYLAILFILIKKYQISKLKVVSIFTLVLLILFLSYHSYKMYNKIKLDKVLSELINNKTKKDIREDLSDLKILYFLDDKLKNDREFMIFMIRRNAWAIKFAGDKLKNNMIFLAESFLTNGLSVYFMDKKMINNKKVIMKLLHTLATKVDYYYMYHLFGLNYLNEELKDDKDIILEAMKYKDICSIRFASERLKDDKDVVLEAVKKSGWALEFASERLRDDKDIVLQAIKETRWAFEYADENLKKDRDFVLEAVRQNGIALQYADKSLKDDEEIVKVAIKQNKTALKYASQRLQKELKNQ